MSIEPESPTDELHVAPKAHSTFWKRFSFLLSVAVYLAVAGFIYHEWFVSLKPLPDEQVREAKAKENRTNYKYFTDVGLQYYQAHEYQKAEAAFRKALEYEPEEALGYSNLGSALSGQRRWDEAISVLEKAVSLDPTLTIAKNNLEYAKTEKAKDPGLK